MGLVLIYYRGGLGLKDSVTWHSRVQKLTEPGSECSSGCLQNPRYFFSAHSLTLPLSAQLHSRINKEKHVIWPDKSVVKSTEIFKWVAWVFFEHTVLWRIEGGRREDTEQHVSSSRLNPTAHYPQLSRWFLGKEPACQCRRREFDPWVEKIPWRRKWQPTPGFSPGKSHGQRSLGGCSPWGHKEVDTS